ncbi:hypothetical protein HMPREF1554_00824 [Porphyromonas gingivalis F0569]|nr:hypothetical protein HMPREF1554_00824 [Porphyromonas gingivalis F0569]
MKTFSARNFNKIRMTFFHGETLLSVHLRVFSLKARSNKSDHHHVI